MRRVLASGALFLVLVAPRTLLAGDLSPVPTSALPGATSTGPNEALLIAGELLVGSVLITGVGLGGDYAITYALPSSNDIPRSTAGSTALNLGGLAALIAGRLWPDVWFVQSEG